MGKTGSAPTPKAIYRTPSWMLHSPRFLLYTLATPLPMWRPMMPRLATVLYNPTRTPCRLSSQHLESFSYRDSLATSANRLRPCLSTTNVLKIKTRVHLMRTLTGTESHQTPVNLEVHRQDPDPELDQLSPMLLNSPCQSVLFNNKRDAAICVRYPAAIVPSSAQNIFVDTSNLSTARLDRTHARSLVA